MQPPKFIVLLVWFIVYAGVYPSGRIYMFKIIWGYVEDFYGL